MRLLFLAIGVALLAFGCAGSAPQGAWAPQAGAPQACNDTDLGNNPYTVGTASNGTSVGVDECVDGASLSEYYCSGGAVASAVLSCPQGLECRNGACAQPMPPQPNVSQNVSPANASAGNASQQNASRPAEPFPPVTNKTVLEMMEGVLAAQQDAFYRANSGTFRQAEYSWVRSHLNASPGDISFRYPAADVKFDGREIASIEGSAFTVFTDVSIDEAVAYGVAVFRAGSTPLDNYSSTDLFIIDYVPGVIKNDLRDCRIYSKDYAADAGGDWLVSYLFRCGTVAPN